MDLSYQKELHDYHSDLALSPENQNLLKLLTTLYDKAKYAVHYSVLKLCLKMGLKLNKFAKCWNLNNLIG